MIFSPFDLDYRFEAFVRMNIVFGQDLRPDEAHYSEIEAR